MLNGQMVALCAARSVPFLNDIYLDDDVHHALSDKFGQDFTSEGFGSIPFDTAIAKLREEAESNNINRTDWDQRYA